MPKQLMLYFLQHRKLCKVCYPVSTILEENFCKPSPKIHLTLNFWKEVVLSNKIFWPSVSFKLGKREKYHSGMSSGVLEHKHAHFSMSQQRCSCHRLLAQRQMENDSEKLFIDSGKEAINSMQYTQKEITSSPQEEDTTVQRWKNGGIFSFNSLYHHYIDGGHKFAFSTLFGLLSAYKSLMLFWLIAKNIILTWPNLQRRCWVGKF